MALKFAIFAIAIDNVFQCCAIQRRGFLCYPSQLPVRWFAEGARINGEFIFQQCKESGFAAAVFAH
ncbi:Uncharacterised protein [Vibrio cholerae]|nr:Uncharacterised protein [Vibrio cholerae]CSI73197.1 Uncharacterised protein [Vibrio cholerae]